VGVSEQRYSSFFIRIFVLISLILPPTAFPGDTAAVASAEADTAVRLPPAFEAMLLVLIGTANFHRPGAIEFLDHKDIPRRDQILRFKAFIKEMIRVYKTPKDYSGPAIGSLGQYVRLVEPTRVHTGSLRGDMEALFRKMEKHDLPPAVRVRNKTDFVDNVALVDAELFEADKSSRLQQLLHSLMGETSMTPTIVGTVLTGALGALFSTRSGVSLVRSFSNHLNGEDIQPEAKVLTGTGPAAPVAVPVADPVPSDAELELTEEELTAPTLTLGQSAEKPKLQPPPNLSSKQKREWYLAQQTAGAKASIVAPAPHTAATSAPVQKSAQAVVPPPVAAAGPGLATLGFGALATTAGIGTLARSTADFLDTYHHLGENENTVLGVLEKLDAADTSDHERILNQFHHRIHDVVLPQIYSIGTTAAQSPQIQSLSETEPRVQKLIKVFFDEYLKLLPSDVIKDIILDLGRAPRETTDYQSLGIVLKHYPPIAQQFFQTVSKMEGLGSFSAMFKKIRDDGWEVPLDQIEEIIRKDPNHYPLTNVKLSGKAGKLYQMVYADYTDAEGKVTPVAVRVLKPGVEKLMEAERVILKNLAPQLSQALKKKDGTGASPRRLEQLIDMIYWNLRQELRVDLTVANQNEGAKRLTRRIEIKIEPHEKAFLNIKVPFAYPAKPQSQVMVMERVENVASLDKISTWYGDLPGALSDVLMDLMVDELMIKPMEANQGKALPGERPHPNEGFMHTDMHSGNFLFQTPRMDGEFPEYDVTIIDFGLVSWVKEDQIANLVKLSVGASYNSAPFITEALWSLRDAKMNNWTQAVQNKAHNALIALVSEKAKELNKKPEYWSTADWVKYAWEEESIELPSWLISLEQGFRAARSSYLELGRDIKEVEQREASYAINHRKLFYKYMKSRASLARHPGWRPIFWYETMHCAARLFGYGTPSN
jgi:tRNA A-37 threonylcarbamoyl transferase component Bud32